MQAVERNHTVVCRQDHDKQLIGTENTKSDEVYQCVLSNIRLQSLSDEINQVVSQGKSEWGEAHNSVRSPQNVQSTLASTGTT